ncbi:MAG: hypothetical protein JRH20_18665, partial [Deltaproteobacteria bacterium]|nr:hypothetical protein [Deltaproteobacteria bacterium]
MGAAVDVGSTLTLWKPGVAIQYGESVGPAPWQVVTADSTVDAGSAGSTDAGSAGSTDAGSAGSTDAGSTDAGIDGSPLDANTLKGDD